MTHVIFDLCIRDGACVEVCPVECIIPGQPEDEWPWYYIDPDTCIDCGACVPECPVEAILPEEDLPEEYQYTTELNALVLLGGSGILGARDGLVKHQIVLKDLRRGGGLFLD